jgi:hypothetical protein
VRTYAEGEPGVPLVLAGSDGYVEVAVRDGSAAALFGGSDGVRVEASRE